MSESPDRTKFIGGSDVAAILGVSPWKTAVQLWEDKCTPRLEGPSKDKKKLFSRGHRWESVVSEMLMEELEREGFAVEVTGENERYIDEEFDFFACEIDREVSLDGGATDNVELKTVHPFAKSSWGESIDDVPIHYTAQAQWGLGVTGRERCIVAPLFGADEIRCYLIERDEELITMMRERAVAFWTDHVLTKTAPAPVSLQDMDILFPKDGEGPALIADEEITELLLRMRAIDREIKARQSERDTMEFTLKRYMQDCTRLLIGEEKKEAVTWKMRKFSHLDQARLKEEHPKLFRTLTKRGESRVFTLKSFAIDGVMP